VVSVPVVDGAHRLTLRRGRKGTIALFGVALERDRPGVVIDGLGVVGRRLGHLHQWDWTVIGAQLARRDPRLVVLQYGTNEADDPDLDLARLTIQHDEVIARIKATVPNASILVLGPPDSAMRLAGRACDRKDRNRQPKPPAVAVDAAVAPECEWHTMPSLPAIIEVQRAAAARHGVAFYDSFAALGGIDRMDALATIEPPLVHGDRVHFTTAGYQLWADGLYADLVAAYARWSKNTAPNGATPPPQPSPSPSQSPPTPSPAPD
jgi:lysophospholipase L1-like esterase